VLIHGIFRCDGGAEAAGLAVAFRSASGSRSITRSTCWTFSFPSSFKNIRLPNFRGKRARRCQLKRQKFKQPNCRNNEIRLSLGEISDNMRPPALPVRLIVAPEQKRPSDPHSFSIRNEIGRPEMMKVDRQWELLATRRPFLCQFFLPFSLVHLSAILT
jgi:hypothetical protein